jgi:hypothetical protein
MEMQLDMSVFILFVGLTGLLTGYLLVVCPSFSFREEADFIYSERLTSGIRKKPLIELRSFHWVRRKIPGRRSGRKRQDGEAASLVCS